MECMGPLTSSSWRLGALQDFCFMGEIWMVGAGTVLQIRMEVAQHNLLVLVGLLLGAAPRIQAPMQE